MPPNTQTNPTPDFDNPHPVTSECLPLTSFFHHATSCRPMPPYGLPTHKRIRLSASLPFPFFLSFFLLVHLLFAASFASVAVHSPSPLPLVSSVKCKFLNGVDSPLIHSSIHPKPCPAPSMYDVNLPRNTPTPPLSFALRTFLLDEKPRHPCLSPA